MIAKEAFKRAFLDELNARGITTDEFVTSMKKQSAMNPAIDDTVGLITKGLVAPALLAPFLAGWQLAKTRRTSKADVHASRDIEMLKTYAQAIGDLDRDAPGRKLKAAAAQPAPTSVQQNIDTLDTKLKTPAAPAAQPPQPMPATGAPATPTTTPITEETPNGTA